MKKLEETSEVECHFYLCINFKNKTFYLGNLDNFKIKPDDYGIAPASDVYIYKVNDKVSEKMYVSSSLVALRMFAENMRLGWLERARWEVERLTAMNLTPMFERISNAHS
jgi:hypothetical protein